LYFFFFCFFFFIVIYSKVFFFFFSSRRRHTRYWRDWSSDVCSSDLSTVIGDGKQPPGIEKSKTSKADLIQALKEAFAYCDQAYNKMTDAQAAEVVSFFGH